MITKEQFFALKPEVKEVQIPALGGSVHVRQMTLAESDRFTSLTTGLKNGEGSPGSEGALALMVYSVCDAEGRLMFSPDDFGAIREMPVKVITELVKAVNEINGFEMDVEAEKKG